PIAVAIAVARREVAIDAAPDAVLFRADGDVLRDDQAAVGTHVDLDVVVEDPLAGLRRDERRGERENQRARQHPDDLREQRPHESCTSTAPRSSSRAW